MITCDEIIDAVSKSYVEETKTVTTNFKEKMQSVKQQKLYIFFAFLLITIALLLAISIYCYLIKCKSKQKHLLRHYVTNGKLINVL